MSIVPKLIYHAATRLRGESTVFHHLATMRGVQTMSASDIERRQAEKLLWLLNFARTNVPYYRDLALAAPAARGSAFTALQEWPLLEKSALQRMPDRLRSTIKQRVGVKSTGGSTGAPVELIKNADGIARERAATWLALDWFGVGVGDRVARFWGTPLNRKKQCAYWLADVAMNRKRLSAFELEPTDLKRHWKSLLRYRPVWLYGYSSVIHAFAEWLEESGYIGADLGLRLVVPTAEPVSSAMESKIAHVFRVPVQNEYGCGEVGPIGYACREGSLHVMSDNVYVEVLREDGSPADVGEMGEVVVTDLTNTAMPLIRYRLGDRSRLLPPCGCGLPFPTIDRVQGRDRDVIVTPKGRRVYGGKIHYHMTTIGRRGEGFSQYQFVQLEAHLVEIRLVVNSSIPDTVVKELHGFAATELDGMQLRIRKVDRIERARSGKLRLVQNEWIDRTAESKAMPAIGS